MSETKSIIKVDNQKSSVVWNSYLATAYAEGFCEGEGASFEEQIEAWSVLIQTGMCWSLQGWFGRNANDLIQGGVISKEGVIDWDIAENLRS